MESCFDRSAHPPAGRPERLPNIGGRLCCQPGVGGVPARQRFTIVGIE